MDTDYTDYTDGTDFTDGFGADYLNTDSTRITRTPTSHGFHGYGFNTDYLDTDFTRMSLG